MYNCAVRISHSHPWLSSYHYIGSNPPLHMRREQGYSAVVSVCLSICMWNTKFDFAAPTSAPVLGEVTRVSATEIQVSWSGDVGPEVEVDSFLIKYRLLGSSSFSLETNQTSYLLTGLEPGFAYAISVAARNRAGVGNFSNEITVGCKWRIVGEIL